MLRHKKSYTVEDTFQVDFERDFLEGGFGKRFRLSEKLDFI